MALTKQQAQDRRWMKQRISYLETDVGRWQAILAARVSSLELLLSGAAPRPEAASDPVAHGVTHGDFLYNRSVLCAACAHLSRQRPDLTSGILAQIHNLHRLSEGNEDSDRSPTSSG